MSGILRSFGQKPNLFTTTLTKLQCRSKTTYTRPEAFDPFRVENINLSTAMKALTATSVVLFVTLASLYGRPPILDLNMPAGDESLANDKSIDYIKRARMEDTSKFYYTNWRYEVFHKPDYVYEDPRDYYYIRRRMVNTQERKIYTKN